MANVQDLLKELDNKIDTPKSLTDVEGFGFIDRISTSQCIVMPDGKTYDSVRVVKLDDNGNILKTSETEFDDLEGVIINRTSAIIIPFSTYIFRYSKSNKPYSEQIRNTNHIYDIPEVTRVAYKLAKDGLYWFEIV